MKIARSLGALVLASALVLTGCGDDSDDSKAGDPSSESTEDTTEDADDAGDADDADEGEEIDVDAFLSDLRDGAEALTSAHMTLTLEAMGQTIEGEGDVAYNEGNPEMAMTLSMGGQGNMAFRLVDGAMYMKIPGQAGSKWLKMGLEKAMDQLGMGDLMDNLDPAKAFEAYAEGFTGVVLIGDEEVGGESTTHYRVTVDTTKVEAFKNFPSGAKLPKTVDYDMWLDDDNRMRKIVMEIPSGTLEMVVSNYGQDIAIEAPPASQVQEFGGR